MDAHLALFIDPRLAELVGSFDSDRQILCSNAMVVK
jgi:hypothetical protein